MSHTELPTQTPVLIAGGGPVGLALAALLAKYGIASLTIEADDTYCTGSRAICISRRSQEIMSWFGADKALLSKGLGWTAGRSYFRDQEVLHFDMPHDPTQRYAPMVNIQQYYIEQYAHEIMQQHPELAHIRWNSRVLAVQQDGQGVRALVESQGQQQWIQAQWLVACDGGRSTVRDCLGLSLKGMQYEGRYVIVDIEQESTRPVERLAWFDPPSNPGSTILMHRQPENVWRIDYQLADDEDAHAAVQAENVLPRVQAHLDMIGETAPWKPLWISLYNAKCLSLESYRHQRVLFAGDAGHLVPIFGVRGLNSGLDDIGNLAWKLAWVMRGQATDDLLDSYSSERVYATQQNISYGAKSTEFMAPPHYGFTLMREATLRLSLVDEKVRSLINPRQSAPIAYTGSALNLEDTRRDADPAHAPGQAARELLLRRHQEQRHFSEFFGQGFVVLGVELSPAQAQAVKDTLARFVTPESLPALQLVLAQHQAPTCPATWHIDKANHHRYQSGCLYLLRPDAYIAGRWDAEHIKPLQAALQAFYMEKTR